MNNEIDDVNDIRDYYDTQVEKEDERLSRHRLEGELTRHWLDKVLPPTGNVLEIGAATGAYTVWLAERGLDVTAVDLTPSLLERNRQRVSEAGLAGKVRFAAADARDLAEVPGQDFDAALVMGPLYHLFSVADRALALQQALARLKPGGILVSSWISRLGIMGDLMKNVPDWVLDQVEVRSILDQGVDPDHWPRGGFRGYFALPEEIVQEHEALGIRTLHLLGVEPAIGNDDESYNRLEGQTRALWFQLLCELSLHPALTASSRHLLYIGRKTG